ncbi:hypothetical protein N7539_002318 [Penicillium diatomitis]|uniref:Uncharacterized protein n=1 Tax=Penicillium diatomitis TaxID=2819901 RepID=A0A9X0BYJ4_9EURO|nr:uncharacterized protein N7539_002318 [Penicillium diatomitis]KAJ5490751.1 hypothetical protein N7539_002318 [Penicillium diatomitis]
MDIGAEFDLPKTFENTLHEQIRKLIEGLPKDLQTSSGSASTKGLSSELCDLHQVLNYDLVHGISRLVRREITSHFRQLDAYPQLVEPVEETILQRLRALRAYWSKPSEDNVATADAQSSQFNKCPACILATIAGNKDILCNLRVVVHSRTQTRRNQHPRKLTLFINHCINRFSPAEADDVRRTSNQLALGMKRARKACVKAYLRDCQIDPSATSRMKRHRRRRRRRHCHQSHDSRKRGTSPYIRTRPGDERRKELD